MQPSLLQLNINDSMYAQALCWVVSLAFQALFLFYFSFCYSFI